MKSLKPRLPRTFKSLELNSEDSRWANADILPCPEEHQTFTNRAFLGYCMLASQRAMRLQPQSALTDGKTGVAAGLNTTAWA
jgi:hypothetical protein